MDRERLIAEIVDRGLDASDGHLDVVESLGRGGNGVAFLCSGATTGDIVAKVYLPPDKRDLDEQSVGRFENEVKLASKIRHPYVIPALGAGTARVGAYHLPYYLMPHAASTLRSMVGLPRSPDGLQQVARVFLQACLGVSCLHSHHVVHRDLKPENVLISRDGTAWVADLGIAHIDPEFVSVSLRTIAAEKLLNRDYYAPEQRFGSHDSVDARADIYALGCILYELLVGAPPVRRDSPAVGSVDVALAALDPVIDRMISYDADARYQHLEAAIVDVSLAFGWVSATIRGARQPAPADLKEMTRLLRSSNGANRSSGIKLASALGAEALSELHDLTGHGRREVRNSVAVALGQIADDRSIPFLVAGLHGNSQKASTFRPTIDEAASALSRFPVERRRAVAHALAQPIRPDQALRLLEGFDHEEAFAIVTDLDGRGLLLLDYSESSLDVFVAIDESAAWPYVQASAPSQSGWVRAHLLQQLAVDHQLELARDWIKNPRSDSWDWDRMVGTIANIPAAAEEIGPLLTALAELLPDYPGQARKRAELQEIIERRQRAVAARSA